jgi:TonB-dependent receptor
MFIWDFASVAAVREATTGQSMQASDAFTTDLRTTEDSTSAYLQYIWNFDIGDMNANLRAGVRYEETEVDSSALVPIPQYISWVAANEYNITLGDPDFTNLSGDYDYVLPNIDFNVNLMEDVVMRASYSQTIGRPNWRDIQGGQTLDLLVRRSFGNGNQGNPALLPLESKNYDLSAEWYYDEGSYLSAAYFFKDTSNYVGFSSIEDTPFNLPHPGNGEWYDECNATTGGASDQVAIRQCIFETYGDSQYVNITGVDAQGNYTGTIQGVPGQDPAALFIINIPTNQQDAEIDGFELAWQHMWGDSGFGTILNYTMVDSDIAYDNGSVSSQFAILGLSDSANAVLFYDKYGWIARLAYNWRDEFLAGTVDGNGIANPVYTEEYGQVDAIVSYTFGESGWTVFLEGFNLTDEYSRSHSRRDEQVEYVTALGPRYGVGVRWVY